MERLRDERLSCGGEADASVSLEREWKCKGTTSDSSPSKSNLVGSCRSPDELGGIMRALRPLVVASLVVLSLLPATAAPAEENANDQLFSPNSEPYGRPYAEWFAEYQEWYNEIPAPVNPLFEPDSPHNCDLEDGKVVFLGASTSCKVREHKAVAFDAGFWECSAAEGLGDTYAELRRCAVENFERDLNPDVHQVRIWIDGDRLRNPRRWTILTPIPSDLIDFPENNIWDADPGPSKSVTKGLFYILRPLSEGTHTIKAELDNEALGPLTLIWKLRVE